MIIQCEKCQTRFRLDDSKVRESGVKVRCTKCKHVFTVRKEEEPEPLVFAAGVTESAAFSAAPDNNTANEISETLPTEPETTSFIPETAGSIDFGDVTYYSDSENPPAIESDSFDNSSISFNSYEAPSTETVTEQEPDAGFSQFDFGDAATDSDVTSFIDDSTTGATEPPTPRKEALHSLDFSDDDMFGSVVQSTPETTAENISFDFGDDSFSDSMGVTNKPSGDKSGSSFSLETSSDAPFTLGEIDFGDEFASVAVQQVNPDDLKPSQKELFSPLADAREQSDRDLKQSFLIDTGPDNQQDLQPLSIASRRKQNPFSGITMVFAAVLIASVLGYIGYSTLSAPKESASLPAGKITVSEVTASFVTNNEVGELLVVSGKAQNDFPKTRAALQVKVAVNGSQGQDEVSKTAYCGNPLTKEQLESLPLSKIESAMANQFGDSLSNMEVAPGKAIPFLVVVANLPKGAKDFSVQPAGSTVATGKQQ